MVSPVKVKSDNSTLNRNRGDHPSHTFSETAFYTVLAAGIYTTSTDATHLNDQGIKPTYARIREMLDSLGRGYTGQPCQIYEALRRLYAFGILDQYPNGRRVLVNGTWYRSIREAAKAERCRQSTVKKRIGNGEPGWSYGD